MSYTAKVSLTLPEGVELADISDLKVVGEGIAVDEFEVDLKGELSADVDLVAGVYKFSVSGKITETTFVVGTAEAEVFADDVEIKIVLTKQTKSSLIIKTIYQASAGYYISDCGVEIVNNSDETQYLDQLILAANNACDNKSANPWQANGFEDLYSAGQAPVLAFPGSGKDYPLEAGESVWVVNTAIAHVKEGFTLPDQSGAAFEIFNTEAGGGDTDTAGVPNMEIIFANNIGMKGWGFGVGSGAYMLARCPEGVTPTAYAADAANLMTTPGTTSTDDYLVINSVNILDAVHAVSADNLTPYSYFLPQDDAAPTTVCTAWSGKVLRRKTEEVDGKTKYVDTNNSKNDFIVDADYQE